MNVRFDVRGVSLDRRTIEQIRRARDLEQERADLAIEAEWRRRVAQNVRRRLTAKAVAT